MKKCIHCFKVLSASLLLAAWNMGCQTGISPTPPSSSEPVSAMTLHPGDDVEINVFGVPELNMIQKIRPDGKISVKLFGDFQAAGKTPTEIQTELAKLYESQLQVKSITVIARSYAVVFVTGAVARPGKVDYLRPLTVFDAIMECGGFDPKTVADRKKVKVIRTEGNQVHRYLVNIDRILMKADAAPFYLKPYDTVYVPISWW